MTHCHIFDKKNVNCQMLSQKARYALRALATLSERYNTDPVQIETISREKKIPLKFLENILLELKRQGILESRRGRTGGYLLALAPQRVSLAKVIRIIDGPIAMLPCVSLYFYKKCIDCNEKECGMNRVFAAARDATLKVLERKTLKDLIAIGKNQDAKNKKQNRPIEI
jgi:Rrf2 family protein